MHDAENAGDDDAYTAARNKAKALRKDKKALRKKIENAGKENVVDQAKIDELKAKIADAKIRRDQAFDDEDDDAEEAAAAEIKELMKELTALTGGVSIPRKKLQDAKTSDFFNSILKAVQNAANGKSDLGVTSTLKYKFEDAGAILIDGSSGAIKVTANDADAEATVIMTLDTFKKLQLHW